MKLTYTLIIIMIVVFVLEIMMPAIVDAFAFSGAAAFSQPWVWITSVFLHDIPSPSHLLANIFTLFFFGLAVEGEMGRKKMLLIFLIGAIAGNAAGLLFYAPDVQAIGASAGIFALVGTGMLVRPLDWSVYPFLLPIPLALLGVLYAVWNLYGFFYGGASDVSYVGHIGGIAIGLLFGFREKGLKKGLKVITLAAVVLVVLLLVIVPLVVRALGIG